MTSNGKRPQSLVLTLYGDYIRHKGDRIRIGALIKLLGLVGVSEQAVRSTVSRMVRRGWLESQRVDGAAYYLFADPAKKLVQEGAPRILNYSFGSERWDGCWHLVTYSIPESMREARDRFRRELEWLGYGMLTNALWISAHDERRDIYELARSLQVLSYVQVFTAQLQGFASPDDIVARCWDLEAINAEYASFIDAHQDVFTDFERRVAAGETIDDSEYFARRFMLIHEYRRFPYRDPHLPPELVPCDWLGNEAVSLFHKYHDLLAKGANRYFESVYE